VELAAFNFKNSIEMLKITDISHS